MKTCLTQNALLAPGFLGSLALSFGYVVEPSPRRADRFERRVSNSPRRRTQLTLIGVGFVAPRSYVDCSGTALKVGFVFQDKPGTVGWRAGATDPKFWWHFQFDGKDQHIIYGKKKSGTNEWVVDPGFPLHLGQQYKIQVDTGKGLEVLKHEGTVRQPPSP